MSPFQTVTLPEAPDALAPDGAEVRILAATGRGSMAHFRLRPGQVTRPVRHRTVDELWFVLAGTGELWRGTDGPDGAAAVTRLAPGASVAIPLGAAFQFRADPGAALEIVAVTMPPWPGADEALPADGPWQACG